MSEILDRLFPIDQCEEDILGGYEDYSNGMATKYFGRLAAGDRDIVQWYAAQNLTPIETEGYTYDLVTGYAVVDPTRSNEGGISSAHTEIARARRFIELFVMSGKYFPMLDRVDEPTFDEAGALTGEIQIDAWTNFQPNRVARNLHREASRIHLALYEQFDRFIDDPLGAPEMFDQDEIVAEHTKALQSGEANRF